MHIRVFIAFFYPKHVKREWCISCSLEFQYFFSLPILNMHVIKSTKIAHFHVWTIWTHIGTIDRSFEKVASFRVVSLQFGRVWNYVQRFFPSFFISSSPLSRLCDVHTYFVHHSHRQSGICRQITLSLTKKSISLQRKSNEKHFKNHNTSLVCKTPFILSQFSYANTLNRWLSLFERFLTQIRLRSVKRKGFFFFKKKRHQSSL